MGDVDGRLQKTQALVVKCPLAQIVLMRMGALS